MHRSAEKPGLKPNWSEDVIKQEKEERPINTMLRVGARAIG